MVGLGSGVIAIAAGCDHTCARTAEEKRVKCWGNNFHGALGDGATTTSAKSVDVIGLNSDVISIAAGGDHACVLTERGEVKCWGWNESGQIGDGTTITRLIPMDVIGLVSRLPQSPVRAHIPVPRLLLAR